MKSPSELAGVALHSPDIKEITVAIDACLSTLDEYLFSECAHGIGHIARRFGKVDKGLLNALLREASRFRGSKHVMGALVDMKDDLDHFVRSQVTKEQYALLKSVST